LTNPAIDENPYRAPREQQARGLSPLVKVLLAAFGTVSIYVVLSVALFFVYRWFGVGRKVSAPAAPPPPPPPSSATH